MLCASCTDTFKVPENSKYGRGLMLTSILHSSDDTHEAIVGWAEYDKVIKLKNAELECYINDKLSDKTDVLIDTVTKYDLSGERTGFTQVYYQRMFFKAEIHEDDKVSLRLKSGDNTAEVELIAPKKPIITHLDTTHVSVPAEAGMRKRVALTADVEDIKGVRSHYRMEMMRESEVIRVPDPAVPAPSIGYPQIKEKTFMSFGNMDDAILDKGMLLPFAGKEGEDYFENKYNFFSDSNFMNHSHRFTLLPALFYARLKTWSPDDKYISNSTIILRLGSMNRATYNYFDAIEFESSSFKALPMIPRTKIPSNISNGVGFVGIITEADAEFILPELRLESFSQIMEYMDSTIFGLL